MKIFKLYESVLNEAGVQACVKAFGKVLFADQLGGDEKNTDLEDDHAAKVHAFTDLDFGENLNPKVMDAIYNLADCMSTYPEVLVPEKEYVYRGTKAPIMNFIKVGQIPTKDKSVEYNYRAISPIQSWADRPEMAAIFGDADDLNDLARMLKLDDISLNEIIPELHDIMIPIILKYLATPDDFLFKSKYLSQLSEHPNESEVIRIDNRPIKCQAFLNEKWLNNDARYLLSGINSRI